MFTKGCIYLIKNTMKTEMLENILFIYYNLKKFLLSNILKCTLYPCSNQYSSH